MLKPAAHIAGRDMHSTNRLEIPFFAEDASATLTCG
jgi:hypothetical protein